LSESWRRSPPPPPFQAVQRLRQAAQQGRTGGRPTRHVTLQGGPDTMPEVIIWTYDWVPEGPRGYVRDLRLRWACEEAGIDYSVRTVPFDDRQTNHLPRQPFGQIPFLSDGELEIFESGAGLLHLARKSEKLMPRDPAGEAETLQWTIAAL